MGFLEIEFREHGLEEVGSKGLFGYLGYLVRVKGRWRGERRKGGGDGGKGVLRSAWLGFPHERNSIVNPKRRR